MEGPGQVRRCAVIGAGIVGVSVAGRLAEAGLKVTLLERAERLAAGQAATRSSFAWLNANEKLPRTYHDFNRAGMRAWAELAAWMGGAAWYRPAGNLEWAADDAGRERLAARVRRLAGWGYPARLIGAAEAAGLEPALRLPRSATEVAWFPGEGYLVTEPLVAELTRRAVRDGALLLAGEAGRVTGFDAGGGVVTAVRTATGEVIPADAVVCCAGRWVPGLAALAGSAWPVPLVPWAEPGAAAPGLVVLAGPVTEPGLARIVHAPGVSLRPHPGGLVHLEAADARVDLHTSEGELSRWAEELLRRARGVAGGLERARVAACRVCVRPMPADGLPLAGWLPGIRGLYVAVTHSGVTLAAHLARLIGAELAGDIAAAGLAHLSAYRPGRGR